MPTKKRKEDMLSNQMLSGIPEIDLGIEYVLLNLLQDLNSEFFTIFKALRL